MRSSADSVRSSFQDPPLFHRAIASVDLFHYCVTFKSVDCRERRTKCLFIHDVRDSQGERGLTHICRRPSDLRRWRYKRTHWPHYPSVVSLVRGFEILNEKYLLRRMTSRNIEFEKNTDFSVEPSKLSKGYSHRSISSTLALNARLVSINE